MCSLCDVMAKVMDCSFEQSESELKLCYFIHFWINTHVKDLVYSPVMG